MTRKPLDARCIPSIRIARPLRVRRTPSVLFRALISIALLSVSGCWFCPDAPDIDALGYGPAGRAPLFEMIVDTPRLPDDCLNYDSASGLGPAAQIELEPYLYFIELAAAETYDVLRKKAAVTPSDCMDAPEANRRKVVSQKYALAKLLNVYQCPQHSDPARAGLYIAEFIIGFETDDRSFEVCLLHSPIRDWRADLEPFYKLGDDGKPLPDGAYFYWMRHVAFAARFFKNTTLASPLNRIRDEKRYIDIPLFVGPLPTPGRLRPWLDLKTELEFNERIGDFIWPVSPWPSAQEMPLIRSRIALRAEPHPDPARAGAVLYRHRGLPVSLDALLAHPVKMRNREQPSVVIRIQPPLDIEIGRAHV